MFRLVGILSLIFGILGASPSQSFAVSCGTFKVPSLSPKCKCALKVKKGTLQRRFKKKYGFSLQRACRGVAMLAKRSCRRKGAVKRFQWKRGRYSVRHVFGYKTGYCQVKYACHIRRKRFSAKRLSKRLFRAKGMVSLTQSRRAGLQRARQKATQTGRRDCGKKYGKVVRFKLGRQLCRKRRRSLRCKFSWDCWYKKRINVYWCK